MLDEGGLLEGIILLGGQNIPGICPPTDDIIGKFGTSVQHTSFYGEKNITLAKSSCINILLTCRICNNKWIICYYKFIIPNLTESICPL